MAVRQSSKLVDVGDVITENSLTNVQLLGGHLQLLQDGVYDIYEPTVEDSHIKLRSYSKNEFWVGTIDIAAHDVDMTTAFGYVIEKDENKEIMVCCLVKNMKTRQSIFMDCVSLQTISKLVSVGFG